MAGKQCKILANFGEPTAALRNQQDQAAKRTKRKEKRTQKKQRQGAKKRRQKNTTAPIETVRSNDSNNHDATTTTYSQSSDRYATSDVVGWFVSVASAAQGKINAGKALTSVLGSYRYTCTRVVVKVIRRAHLGSNIGWSSIECGVLDMRTLVSMPVPQTPMPMPMPMTMTMPMPVSKCKSRLPL